MSGVFSFDRSSSPELPELSSMGAAAKGKMSDPFEIDDDDLDELAENVPCSSPYFTQPTQIVAGKAAADATTQPTQIVEKKTTLHQSSPRVPETPGRPASVVEVPASSPFRDMTSKMPGRTGSPLSKLQSRPIAKGGRLASAMAPAGTAYRPPTAAVPSRRVVPAAKTPFLDTSDDDLSKDYEHHNSSEDEEKPMRGDIKPSTFAKTKSPAMASRLASMSDISLNDIHDLRIRYLVKETKRIVSGHIPDITLAACKSAVTKSLNAEDAVNLLLGRPKASVPSKRLSANGSSRPAAGNTTKPAMKQTTLTSLKPSPSPALSQSSLDTSSEARKAPQRRKLMQGRRRRTPSPPPVFSIPSSRSSPATSQSSSAGEQRNKRAKAAVSAVSSPEVVSRGRLVRGPRPKAPVIELDSDSDDELLAPQPAQVSKKRKATEQPPPDVIDIADSDDEPLAKFSESNSDTDDDSPPTPTKGFGEHDKVLQYLNQCSAEDLQRISGMPVSDTKLVVAAQPFSSLEEAQEVSRKVKSGARKASKVSVGFAIVEKLVTWFKAFKAAAAAIKACEDRGKEIESVMSEWEMDRNGLPRKDKGLQPLPIKKRPSLMDESVELKSYQLLGLNWMNLIHKKGYSGILADDMGLGKTCQVISFISHLVESSGPDSDEKCWPNLIVVPPSTYENWMNEFQKFAPGIKLFPYSGKNRRDTDPEDAQDYHVVLTTYSQVESKYEDLAWLQGLSPYAAIFDEGHKLKNQATLVYKQLMRVPSEWRLILTGTPVQNNLKELLSLLNFVEPSLFENRLFDDLKTMFEAKVANKDVLNFASLAKERVSNARVMMAPFILQRRKNEVLALPPRKDSRVVVALQPEQKAIYDQIRGQYLEKGRGAKDRLSNPWMQLRKAAIHPQLFRRHFTDQVVAKMTNILWSKCSEAELGVQSKSDKHKGLLQDNLMSLSDFELHIWCKDFPRYIGHLDIPARSWEKAPKVAKLLELVRGYMATGDRCLVFSRFEMVINILRETFHTADIPYCELTGSAGVADRFPEVERYTANPEIPVFLLTTGAGGTGINLTAANKIIIFDQSDNPQDDVQASNRAHRIGQTREVEVITLISENTVEGLIYNSCIKKLMLAACVEGAVDDGESVEDQCKKMMLMDSEAEVRAVQNLETLTES